MRRKLIYSVYAVFVLVIAASIPAGAAVPITVQNYSLELPGNGKIIGWDMVDGAHYESGAGGGPAEVPGWESDGAIADSGVETGYTPTNGTYTGFIKGNDPNVYNLTNFPIGQGDVFELAGRARILDIPSIMIITVREPQWLLIM
jgi:hypothetical protein